MFPDYILIGCQALPNSVIMWILFCIGKSIKVFFNKIKEQAQVWVSRKLYLVAEEGPRRLKQDTKNTNNTCILNCGNVCHIQCQNYADHKHQIKDC